MKRTQPPASRRFFRVLGRGFRQKLNLPPDGSKELQKAKSRRVTLDSRIGTWKVRVDGDDDMMSFSGEGWVDFVHRHAFTDGEFLVFEPVSQLHFNVTAFDFTWCEKEFQV